MTSVLITGAAGFIGSRLVNHLRRANLTVLADVQLPALAPANEQPVHRATLTVGTLIQAAVGVTPDVIVHAAGSSTVAQVAVDPARELPESLAAMLAVLEYARTVAPRARVILLSSAAVYGSAPAEPQRETQDRDPISHYGVAKAQAEQLMAFYARQHCMSTTAVRLFSVYGPGLRKQLLWDAMTKFKAGRSDFFGTGQELRDWVHVDDVCRFMDALLVQGAMPGFKVFNCASGGRTASTSDVLSAMATLANAPQPAFNGQTRSGDPACLVADCGKAERELGWRAQVPWQTGVAEYVAWFAAHAASATGSELPTRPASGSPR